MWEVASFRQNRIKGHSRLGCDGLLQRNRLFEIGVLVLVAGAIASLIGGLGEASYYQCIGNSGAACTSSGNTQYFTVLLANADVLNVGLSVVLVGALLMIGGSITNFLAKLSEEMKASMSPSRICPKCGAQTAGTSKFCQSCGNKLVE